MSQPNIVRLHRNDEVSVTFDYTVAFVAAWNFVQEHCCGKTSMTQFIVGAIHNNHKIAKSLGIIENEKIITSKLELFNQIKLYRINDKHRSNTELDIRFKSADQHSHYNPKGHKPTSIKLPAESVGQLNQLAQIWKTRNRSVLLANAASIFALLIYEKHVNGLAPSQDFDLETGIYWKE